MLIMDNSKELSRKKFEATSKKLLGQQNVETAWFQARQEELKKRHQTAILGLIPQQVKRQEQVLKIEVQIDECIDVQIKERLSKTIKIEKDEVANKI